MVIYNADGSQLAAIGCTAFPSTDSEDEADFDAELAPVLSLSTDMSALLSIRGQSQGRVQIRSIRNVGSHLSLRLVRTS